MVGVLLAVLAVLLIFELPRVLHLGGKKSAASAPTTPTPAATTPRPHGIPKGLHGKADPFTKRGFVSSDSQVGPEVGGRDPFAAPSTATTPAAPVAQPVSKPLPQQIVIGTPGAGRHAHRGWIVILASIPTGEGRTTAEHFAARASRVGELSILNSSNRRPLRGGYWVVYAGPYNTLGQVTSRAGDVHAAGYPTAYVRELIVYR